MTNIDDAIAATAFRRLIAHLQHRTDAQNVLLADFSSKVDALEIDAAQKEKVGFAAPGVDNFGRYKLNEQRITEIGIA